MELHKILIGRFAAPLMFTMLDECELHKQLLLPQSANLNEFRRVADANMIPDKETLNLEPSTALATLLNTMDEANAFQKRVKFSNNERFLCQFIVAKRQESIKNKNNALYFKKLILDQIFSSGSNLAF